MNRRVRHVMSGQKWLIFQTGSSLQLFSIQLNLIHRLPAAVNIVIYNFNVINGHQQVTLQTALCTQSRLYLLHQIRADSLSAKRRVNSQMIDQSAPAIKTTNYRADDRAL